VPDLTRQLDERDELHRAEQLQHQAEIGELKKQLEAMQKEHQAELNRLNTSLSQGFAEEKELLQSQAQKLRDQLNEAEEQGTSVRKELDDLKGKANTWLSALTKINTDMASKCFSPFLSFNFRRHK